ncbi:HEXXH motif domain-containing protein [Streptomyces sp. H27-D2]|uniref:HEXXH motif domain-containing protein n=1 Tax=Streptomyces sp. H27-D2 TaxID=3046304 RepID=UPI002DB6D1C7|nr:HEXXH motif domain-containing protein [Streptomyces sp. H27-D2]MEC4018355.1 HEXXH motif domain-containing protein [Streptomyces sp. H27-D2]
MPHEQQTEPPAPPARRHALAPRHFDALAAGGGGASAMAHLWSGERSHRLLLLDLLLKTVADRPDATGSLPPVSRAWELLIAAERRDRAVTDRILLLPETGLWLIHSLLRLQKKRPAPDEPPLWIDVCHLHTVAAAAAIRAGLDFSLRVPARSGAVWLPSVGRASLPDTVAWGAAEVTFHGGVLNIRSEDGNVRFPPPLSRARPGWEPPRTLTLERAAAPEDPLSIDDSAAPEGSAGSPAPGDVFLDDLSSYRIFPVQPSYPQRECLSDESAGRWTTLLNEAWPLLCRTDPQSAEDIAACLRTIEPLSAKERFRLRSATSGDGIGGVATSEPSDAAQCAAVLTHEIQHSKLSALMHMHPLHSEENAARLYAPWRDDPRPLRGMLQGAYAFTGVARFWRARMLDPATVGEDAILASFEFALRRNQLRRALKRLAADRALTPLGRRLVEKLTGTVLRWETDQVPPDALAEAEHAADDHAMSWRLHHLAPHPSLLDAAVRSWLKAAETGPSAGTAGSSATGADPEAAEPPAAALRMDDFPGPRLDPDAFARHLDSRTVLRRMRLTEPILDKLRDTPDGIGAIVSGARMSDLTLVTGDAAAARRLYTAEIMAASAPDAPPPDEGGGTRPSAAAWAGLRLALADRDGRQPAVRALSTCPELVRDVHSAVREKAREATDPVAVATWLGRALPEAR